MLVPEVKVEKKVIEEELTYKRTVILTYKIEYPCFQSARFTPALKTINAFYEQRARKQERYAKRRLFRQAMEQYEYAKDHGYPFNPYQLISMFQVTYNRDCTLSLYSDRYVYTGGANGDTVRSSETWELRRGRQMELQQFFNRRVPYREYILKNVLSQIRKEIADGEGNYFDGYEKNAAEDFDPDQFYLVPEGIKVYYQLYTIAPHSSGIPTFLIPFDGKNVYKPRC